MCGGVSGGKGRTGGRRGGRTEEARRTRERVWEARVMFGGRNAVGWFCGCAALRSGWECGCEDRGGWWGAKSWCRCLQCAGQVSGDVKMFVAITFVNAVQSAQGAAWVAVASLLLVDRFRQNQSFFSRTAQVLAT